MAILDPIQSLVEYVEEVKPYHTKVIDVVVEYVYEDTANVSFNEKLEFNIQLDFDRYQRICLEGFGFPGLGKLSNGEMPLNLLYNPASPDYIPELDRNNVLFDSTALTGSPAPTQEQKDASLVYVEGIESSPGFESNWDNFNCASQQESLVQTTFVENFELTIERTCSFNSDFYITLDRDGFYQYNNDNSQVEQSSYTSSPGYEEGRAYGNIVIDGTVGGKYYWEYLLDNINVGDTNKFSVGVGFYDDTLNPPYDIPDEMTLRVGADSNSYGYSAAGTFLNSNSTSGSPDVLASSDIVGIAVDLDIGQVEFFRNNVSQGSVVMTNTLLSFSPVISMELSNSSSALTLQAAGSLTYTPPVGFIAISCPDSSPGSP